MENYLQKLYNYLDKYPKASGIPTDIIPTHKTYYSVALVRDKFPKQTKYLSDKEVYDLIKEIL